MPIIDDEAPGHKIAEFNHKKVTGRRPRKLLQTVRADIPETLWITISYPRPVINGNTRTYESTLKAPIYRAFSSLDAPDGAVAYMTNEKNGYDIFLVGVPAQLLPSTYYLDHADGTLRELELEPEPEITIKSVSGTWPERPASGLKSAEELAKLGTPVDSTSFARGGVIGAPIPDPPAGWSRVDGTPAESEPF